MNSDNLSYNTFSLFVLVRNNIDYSKFQEISIFLMIAHPDFLKIKNCGVQPFEQHFLKYRNMIFDAIHKAVAADEKIVKCPECPF
ncbi:hypothetical protein SAMN04487995_4626 [Dyadobacter koreensis]|uniref:Uncharacterized protein n=1 Tax=Dyadobacter koreensis TaxID=408657 RepID=A0A1H6YZZ5_9BACT|nr:hypothetical protein SAMN04487995_4626 [Dyadobacter koreensis]